MHKIMQRLLMFAVGVPSVLAVVLLFPQKHHLVANIVVVAMSALGGIEFAAIIGKGGYKFPKWEAAVLASLAPLSTALSISYDIHGEFVLAVCMTAAAWVISSRIFSPIERLSIMAERASVGLSVLVYPGMFMVWIVRLTSFKNAGSILIVYLLTVFANDSLAWLCGVLFGKGNRGVIAVSPNKSVAGFIGGFSASILVGAVAPFVFPAAFTSDLLPSSLAGAIMGLLSGTAAIVGDLAESAVKRSASIKDSGTIIPGRGGVLDSIDSLSFAAPVFYVVYRLLF